jgi:lipopolysaccharide biosynthesis regulator YciM
VAAGKPPDPTAEQVASGKMNLVRAFRRNGFLDKAEALLKQILADYPNCSVAADAQKQLIEVQDELKQPGGKAP